MTMTYADYAALTSGKSAGKTYGGIAAERVGPANIPDERIEELIRSGYLKWNAKGELISEQGVVVARRTEGTAEASATGTTMTPDQYAALTSGGRTAAPTQQTYDPEAWAKAYASQYGGNTQQTRTTMTPEEYANLTAGKPLTATSERNALLGQWANGPTATGTPSAGGSQPRQTYSPGANINPWNKDGTMTSGGQGNSGTMTPKEYTDLTAGKGSAPTGRYQPYDPKKTGTTDGGGTAEVDPFNPAAKVTSSSTYAPTGAYKTTAYTPKTGLGNAETGVSKFGTTDRNTKPLGDRTEYNTTAYKPNVDRQLSGGEVSDFSAGSRQTNQLGDRDKYNTTAFKANADRQLGDNEVSAFKVDGRQTNQLADRNAYSTNVNTAPGARTYGQGANATALDNPTLDKAIDKAEARLDGGSVYSPEKMQEFIDFYGRDYKKAFEDQAKQLERQAIAQGLWWSGDRAKANQLNLESFNDRVSQNVVVPLMKEALDRQATDERANIDQAARLGQQTIDNRYKWATFGEGQRQFDAQTKQAAEQFADNLGLSYNQLQESINARLAGNDLQDRQMQTQIDQFIDQYNLQKRGAQFGEEVTVAEINQRKMEFAENIGLSASQLEESINARLAGNDLQDRALQTQIDQFIDQYGLQKRAAEFGEEVTVAELNQRKAEFAEQMGLSAAQLEESINARLAGNDLQDRQLQTQIDQFIDQYNLQKRGEQFKEEFSLAELNQRKAEFAEEIGLSASQLEEAINARLAGDDYRNRSLDASVDQFIDEMNLRRGEALGEVGGRVTLAGRSQTVQEMNAEVDRAIARANSTGEFIDPETGQSKKTLESWRTQLQEAQLTGTLYNGESTLERLAQEWDQTFRDKATFGFDDEDGNHVYGTNELQVVMQKNEQEFAKMLEAGFRYTDPDTGETRYVMGTDEKVRDERVFQERVRTGYDEPVLGPDGKPYIGPNGKPVFRKVLGTQEFQERIADRELDLQEKGLSLDDAHRQAVLEWEKDQYGGFHQMDTISASSLGLDVPPSLVTPEGGFNPHEYTRWVNSTAGQEAFDRLEGALGRQPTQADFEALASGQRVAVTDENGNPKTRWVEGTAGLEVSRVNMQMELQKAGFTQETSERIAQQAYEDKVRNGHFAPGPDGEMQWIRGNQDHEEYMLTLQNTLGLSREQAERKWAEQQRVGYTKYEEVMTPNGPMIREMKIEGTQDFQERLAQAERDGREDLTSLQWELNEKQRRGYFKQVGNSFEWVAGEEEFEQAIRDQADEMVREGWTHDAAMQQARITATDNLEASNRAHNKFLQERQWYYEQKSIDKADARQKAEQDWQSIEKGLDRELSRDLADKEITAEDKRLKAKQRQDNINNAVAMAASIAKDFGAGWFSDKGDSISYDLTTWTIGKVKGWFGVDDAGAEKILKSTAEAGGFATVLTADGVSIVPTTAALSSTPGVVAAPGGAAGLALAGPIAVAAILAVGSGIYHQKKEASRRDAFDAAYEQMPPELQTQLRSLWEADYTDPYQGTAWGDRESKWKDRDMLFAFLEDIQKNGGKPLNFNNGRNSQSAAGRAKQEKADRAYEIYQLIENGDFYAGERPAEETETETEVSATGEHGNAGMGYGDQYKDRGTTTDEVAGKGTQSAMTDAKEDPRFKLTNRVISVGPDKNIQLNMAWAQLDSHVMRLWNDGRLTVRGTTVYDPTGNPVGELQGGGGGTGTERSATGGGSMTASDYAKLTSGGGTGTERSATGTTTSNGTENTGPVINLHGLNAVRVGPSNISDDQIRKLISSGYLKWVGGNLQSDSGNVVARRV